MAATTKKTPPKGNQQTAPVRKDGPATGAQGGPTKGGKIFGNKWAGRTRTVRSA